MDGSTSTALTGRSLWQRSRGVLAAVLALLLVSGLAAALRASGSGGELDPASYAPAGARAVATLLRDRGVQVQVVGDLPRLQAALGDGPASTVLVAQPGALTAGELGQVGRLDAPRVVLGADPDAVDALDLPVTVEPADVAVRRPACSLPAAVVAGSARTGGSAYRADAVGEATGDVSCYSVDGQATVLALPDRQTTLVGEPDVLSNERLGEDGNAALALGLLDARPRVLWLLPDPGRAVAGGQESVRDLLPDGVLLGVLQLLVAVVLLALWRARRLGRVVVEPLPVVVRAAEAVEGRGRLYAAAGARDAAADALRAGARDRLARRLGLPPEPERRSLVATLAARAGADPAAVDLLLYGPAPADDAALVRLADALDGLDA